MRLTKLIFIAFLFTIFLNVAFAIEIKSEIENKIYSKLNNFAQNIGKNFGNNLSNYENLKYLDFSINIQEGFDPSIEVKSVYKLIEYDDGALFNQLNLISQDNNTTINLGLGKRKLFDILFSFFRTSLIELTAFPDP